MVYRVKITSGKGKNLTISGSTPLKNKQAVTNWVKRNPVGNSNSRTTVFNTITKKTYIGNKLKFQLKKW